MKEKNLLRNILLILLGNTIYALAVVSFVIPHQLVVGGTTGIGLFLNHQFQIPISSFVSIFNIVMFIIGLVILGKKFALTTLLSTFYYPLILSQLEKMTFLTTLTDNKLVAVILAGCMIGIGIGLVIKLGASTGGMDIPPLVLNKKLGLPVAVGMYTFDFTILLLQMTYSKWNQVILGILLVAIYTTVLSQVLKFEGITSNKNEPVLE